MGCGASTDQVHEVSKQNVSKNSEEVLNKSVSAKQQAISNVFGEDSEVLIKQDYPKNEYITPKIKLVRRQTKPDKNVNALIEDKTLVWDIS